MLRGQVARDYGGDDQREVVDGRRYAELTHAVVARKVVYDKTRRERHNHTCAYTQHATDNDKPHYAVGKQTRHAADEEYRNSRSENFYLILAYREVAGNKDKGDNQ